MFNILHNIMTITTAYQFFNKDFCIPYYTSIVLLWIIYKNECIVSFFDKVKINKNYNIGDNGYSTPDLIWSKLNAYRIDRLLSVILIPLYYYLITKSIPKSIILALILIILLTDNNQLFFYITTSRFRYILLFFILIIMTDNNLNKNLIVNLYNILLPISFLLILYTFFKYNYQKDIHEMTIVAILSIIILLFKNNVHYLKKLI